MTNRLPITKTAKAAAKEHAKTIAFLQALWIEDRDKIISSISEIDDTLTRESLVAFAKAHGLVKLRNGLTAMKEAAEFMSSLHD